MGLTTFLRLLLHGEACLLLMHDKVPAIALNLVGAASVRRRCTLLISVSYNYAAFHLLSILIV